VATGQVRGDRAGVQLGTAMTHYLHNIRREHDALTAMVRDRPPEDAQRALLHLFEYMADPCRFVPGSNLYDSMIRDLIEDAYGDQPSVIGG
jgi:hypothetical protein